jgi:hypothetical protein
MPRLGVRNIASVTSFSRGGVKAKMRISGPIKLSTL